MMIEKSGKRKKLIGKEFETFAEAYEEYLRHEAERVEELKRLLSDMKKTTELIGRL